MSPPEVFGVQELLVQAIIRQHLSVPENLSKLLEWAGVVEIDVDTAEVLGEKALPEGHVDLMVKSMAPVGRSPKVVIEVKNRAASKADLQQLREYCASLGDECA